MFSTPTVAGDLLLVGSCNGFYRALARSTGEVRWTYDTRTDGSPAEFHGDPLVTEELVIVGSDSREPSGVGHLYAFEKATGRLRWKFPTRWGVTSDILRQGSKVYAVTLEDKLVCLDVKTGRSLWSFASGFLNPDFHFNSTPALAKGRVFFGGLNGILYCLDAVSGRILWKRDLDARVSTSLLFAKDSLVVGSSNKHLYRLAADGGAILGDATLEAEPSGRMVPAGGDVFLAFLGEKTLVAVNLSAMKIGWSQKAAVSWSSARPYLWNDLFLAGNDQGELFAFRVADGVAVWSETFEGVIRGIGSAEDTLYVGTLKGLVYAWSAATP